MIIFRENGPTEHLNENVILTLGSFDGIHKGHKILIEKLVQQAKEENLKSFVTTFKVPPALVMRGKSHVLTTMAEKIYILENFGVDYVWFLDFSENLKNMDYQSFWSHYITAKMNLKIFLCGEDHGFGKNKAGNLDTITKLGKKENFKIYMNTLMKNNGSKISSTDIRKSILAGKFENATSQLSHYYLLLGRVVGGDKLGAKLGFPTANIDILEEKLLPPNGVYFGAIKHEEKIHRALIYIGNRPTMKKLNYSSEQRLEVFIMDFQDDIYEKELPVYFIKRIRDDIVFENISALRHQIQCDVEKTQSEKIETKLCI